MRVPRTFVEGARPGAAVEIGGDAFRHLVRVLRRSEGDPLVVFDGAGGAFHAVVAKIDGERGTLRVAVGDPVADEPAPATPLAVALGLPRGDGFETALRWGSEMGLARLIPLLAARCTARPPAGDGSRRKVERWERIVRESAEQCRRTVPMAVEGPVDLPGLLARLAEFGPAWIAVPGGEDLSSSGLAESLAAAAALPPGSGGPAVDAPARPVLVLVGPEGGFTVEEVARSRAAGIRPVGFPTPVLRAPTAVAYLAAFAALAIRPR